MKSSLKGAEKSEGHFVQNEQSLLEKQKEMNGDGVKGCFNR